MKLAGTLTAMALAGSTALSFSAPATSAPLMQDNGLRSPAVSGGIEDVRWRGHGNRNWHGGPRHHRGHRHGWGPALGGIAAGALIGGAIANSRAQAYANEVAYCSRRFKSYDPASGTYLGYDGLRHPCP